MTRQVTFACNIACPKARDTPRSGHPAPTRLPCQPSRFHPPAPHQANPPSAQHSAREQEREETARQSTLTVTFTARKSPVQATSHARQPAPAARRYLFQSSFHRRPTCAYLDSLFYLARLSILCHAAATVDRRLTPFDAIIQ
jgi:hypothetical protein